MGTPKNISLSGGSLLVKLVGIPSLREFPAGCLFFVLVGGIKSTAEGRRSNGWWW
jgi:hypothetical protein